MNGVLRVWWRLRKNRLTLACLCSLAALVVLVVAAPLLPLADRNATALDQRLIEPLSSGYWLGTDHLGRDLLARLVFGARLSLGVALLGVTLAALLGSCIGLVAGYYSGRVDGVLMRLVDVLMAFPYLLLALAIVAVLGPGLRNATIAIALVNVPFFARTVRGHTLSLRKEPFVDAARLSGLSDGRILYSEILPGIVPTIIVAASTSSGWMILETAGLSFLGLGAQPPTADLGGMLGQGRHLLATAPHVSLIPGAFIFFVVALLNVLGDGLGDALDPRRVETGAAASEQAQAASALDAPEDTPSIQASDGGAESRDPLISVTSLSVSFQQSVAVRALSFAIGPGEKVGLVGESGSGKSVTALAVLGILEASARVRGKLSLFGKGLEPRSRTQLGKLRGGRLAWIPQDPMTSLHPLMRVGAQLTESLELHRGLTGAEARAEGVRLLTEVGIVDPEAGFDAWPHQLSGGMRQRAVIAMALAGESEVLIADEPTTALDVTTQAAVLECLESLCARRGLALLFITHDLALLSQLCDRVLVMYRGTIVERGSTRDVLERPQHPYTKQLISNVVELGAPERILGPRGAQT
jgi:peptide/nickel transport system permease protein